MIKMTQEEYDELVANSDKLCINCLFITYNTDTCPGCNRTVWGVEQLFERGMITVSSNSWCRALFVAPTLTEDEKEKIKVQWRKEYEGVQRSIDTKIEILRAQWEVKPKRNETED